MQEIRYRPEGTIQNSSLFFPKIDIATGKMIGVTDNKGRYFSFDKEEQFIVKHNGKERQEIISLNDGREIPLEDWEPWRIANNLDALREIPELGDSFAEIYATALHLHPELANVDIVTSTPRQNPELKRTGGFARHQSKTEKNRPLVVMNGEAGKGFYEELRHTRELSTKISAIKLGIAVEDMTPSLLAQFIFAHELGHAFDYLKYPNYDEYQKKRQEEMNSLPARGRNPAELANALTHGGKLDSWWYDNQGEDGLIPIDGVGRVGRRELLQIQEEAYHKLSTEDSPDQFAVEILNALREKV